MLLAYYLGVIWLWGRLGSGMGESFVGESAVGELIVGESVVGEALESLVVIGRLSAFGPAYVSASM